MSEDFEDDEISILNNFLQQYASIKTSGTPCLVKEARKWYTQVANEAQANVNKAAGYYLINTAQKLPHSKIDDDNLELILDDGECLKTYIDIWHTSLMIVHELYKNPSNYDYWKGEVTIDIEGEKIISTAYYFEHKPEKINGPEGMFI